MSERSQRAWPLLQVGPSASCPGASAPRQASRGQCLPHTPLSTTAPKRKQPQKSTGGQIEKNRRCPYQGTRGTRPDMHPAWMGLRTASTGAAGRQATDDPTRPERAGPGRQWSVVAGLGQGVGVRDGCGDLGRWEPLGPRIRQGWRPPHRECTDTAVRFGFHSSDKGPHA